MRKLQKIFAVSATTAMTLAMGVSAFADTTVTYHFYNASKWDKVGAWVKQSIDWKDDCLPLDKCVLKDTIDGTAPHEPIWPGATMEAEGNDWYKVTCTYTDFSKGSMMIFNNYVGDSVATDTTSDADIAKIQAAGITTDSNGKLQTPNIMIKKGSEAASDYYINYDGNGAGSLIVIGKSDMVTTTPPANYPSSAAPAADGTAAPAAGTAAPAAGTTTPAGTTAAGTTAAGTTAAGTTAAGTTAAAGTGVKSNTNSPKTGDAVAVSTLALAAIAAIAVVASKKKVNA